MLIQNYISFTLKSISHRNIAIYNLVLVHLCHSAGQVTVGQLAHNSAVWVEPGYKYELTPWDSSDTGEEPR